MVEREAAPGSADSPMEPADEGRTRAERSVEAPWIELAWVEQGIGHRLRWIGPQAQAFIGQSYQRLLDERQVQSLLRRLGWREYRWAVYGRRRDPSEVVLATDRIELSPPLRADPMIARNRRVAHRRRQAERSRWLPDRRNTAARED